MSSNVELDNDGSGKRCSFYRYEFELPKAKRKEFNAVRTAFQKDMPKAYNVFTKSAGTTASRKSTAATRRWCADRKPQSNVSYGGTTAR